MSLLLKFYFSFMLFSINCSEGQLTPSRIQSAQERAFSVLRQNLNVLAYLHSAYKKSNHGEEIIQIPGDFRSIKTGSPMSDVFKAICSHYSRKDAETLNFKDIESVETFVKAYLRRTSISVLNGLVSTLDNHRVYPDDVMRLLRSVMELIQESSDSTDAQSSGSGSGSAE